MDRIKPKLGGNYVSFEQAGTDAATLHYVRMATDMGAAEAKRNGPAAVARMRAMPTDDACFGSIRIHQDGQAMHPAYLFQCKTPAQSHGPWDLYNLIATIPPEGSNPAPGACKPA